MTTTPVTRRRFGFSVAGLALLAAACTTTDVATEADGQLTTEELRSLLTGRTVSFSSGGVAVYYADGRYEFRGDGISRGRYRFGNGLVCVQFIDGSGRCDRYERRGDGYVLINAQGRRFRATIS